jgi:hypothetical protein
MPVKKGESRAGAAKKSRDVFDESEVPTVAFLERVKVHDVKLADVNRSRTVGVRTTIKDDPSVSAELQRRKKVLPPSLEDAHARPVIPTCTPHPLQTRWVAFDDDMLRGLSILKICINLYSAIKEEYVAKFKVDMHHSNPKSNV